MIGLESYLKEIERRIEEFRQKYGMDFDEFFKLVEVDIGRLLDRGFDLGEILEDSLVWEKPPRRTRRIKEKS